MSNKWLDDQEIREVLGLPPEESANEEKEDVVRTNQSGEREAEEGYSYPRKEVETHPVQFEELTSESYEGGDVAEFEMLFDVPLEVRVLLGSVEKTVEEVLELEEGSILETEQLAGEPVEIIVGNQAIAKGEVVMIDDKFGVLITEIVPPRERIERVEGTLKRQKQ